MLPFLALVIAVVCVGASFRRLVFALTPTSLDVMALGAALRGDAGRARLSGLKQALAGEDGSSMEWERSVLDAAASPAEQRVALLNEQLQELDWRIQRWARVPRVCASITTSSGFLLATVAMREGLVAAPDMPPELQDMAMRAAMTYAIDVAAIGLAGAAFCMAIQFRARKAAKDRAEAADKLVERLEALGS